MSLCPPGKTLLARSATAAPVQKVQAAMVVGAISTLVVALINMRSRQPLPTGLGEALVYLLTIAAGYLTPPAPGEVVVECKEDE